jgi:hypothetical protein
VEKVVPSDSSNGQQQSDRFTSPTSIFKQRSPSSSELVLLLVLLLLPTYV